MSDGHFLSNRITDPEWLHDKTVAALAGMISTKFY